MRERPKGRPRPASGFTIVELLVVISMIGMLMALILPAVQQAREAGRRNTCSNNLKNCTLAVLNYESAKGEYPGWREPLELVLPCTGLPAEIPVSWVVVVLPYLERSDLYGMWRNPQQCEAAGIDSPPQVYLSVVNCPSSQPPSSVKSPCVYVVNSGMDDTYPLAAASTSGQYPADFQANGMFFNHYFQPPGLDLSPIASVACLEPIVHTNQNYVTAHDGSSHTLLATENNNVPTFAPMGVPPQGLSGGPGSWGDPAVAAYEKQNCFIFRPEKNPDPALNINGQPGPPTSPLYYYFFLHPASAHPGGVNASFCDGHVRYLSETIDYGVFCLLMTPLGSLCNTPGTIGGLDGAGGVPQFPTSWWYSSDNYAYLRTAAVDDSTVP